MEIQRQLATMHPKGETEKAYFDYLKKGCWYIKTYQFMQGEYMGKTC
jgi:hypothetical protein